MAVSRVVIVGAGITGSLLALSLEQRGITPVLVEITEDWSALGSGITVQGNLLRMLGTVGVADVVIAAGYPYPGFTTRRPDGEVIAHVTSPPLGGPDLPASVGAMRPSVQHALSRAIDARGIDVRLGTTVTEFVDGPDSVSVTFSDGTTDSFDLLVGADGVRSSIRPMLGIDTQPGSVGVAIWRVVAPRPAELTQTNLFFGGPHPVAGMCPVNEHQMYGYLLDEDVRRNRDDEPFHELLSSRLESYGGMWDEVRATIGPESAIDYRSLDLMLVEDPWYRGRAIVIGDAAHICPPVLAQGAAMGAEDAVVLADCLDSDEEPSDQLAAFMARRMHRVKTVVDVSMEVTRREVAGHTAATDSEVNLEQVMESAMVMLSTAP
jgi:2-polyprenyl-6-methoxyphenol hydroxylase-like FAD-dependent oxidoreductase